jgi:hypothetical protein
MRAQILKHSIADVRMNADGKRCQGAEIRNAISQSNHKYGFRCILLNEECGTAMLIMIDTLAVN